MTHLATTPHTPQPIAQPGDPARMHRADARSTLAAPVHDIASVAAIICAFGFAPLGIILGHAAAREARRTGRQPSGPATGGIVPGYIFTAIGLITVPAGGSGNWKIIWTYNEGSFGQSVNFGVTSEDFQANVSKLGPGGSGTEYVYGDPGTHHLSVISEGNWTVQVVTAS